MCYENENAGRSGMCNCYNCASETRIIKEYRTRFNDNRSVDWFVNYFTEITNYIQGYRHHLHENYTTTKNIPIVIPEYKGPVMNRSYVYGDNAVSASVEAPKDLVKMSSRVIINMERIEGVRPDDIFRGLPEGKNDPKFTEAVDVPVEVRSAYQ